MKDYINVIVFFQGQSAPDKPNRRNYSNIYIAIYYIGVYTFGQKKRKKERGLAQAANKTPLPRHNAPARHNFTAPRN
jgi:hypothetical protein